MGLAAAAVVAAGCSTESTFTPPAQTPVVRAEQARLASLVERHVRPMFSATRGSCDVRLLGSEGAVRFAWAQCSFPGRGGDPNSALSAPVRVDGGAVQLPSDGSEFAASVRRLFPKAIARSILERPDSLRPRS